MRECKHACLSYPNLPLLSPDLLVRLRAACSPCRHRGAPILVWMRDHALLASLRAALRCASAAAASASRNAESGERVDGASDGSGAIAGAGIAGFWSLCNAGSLGGATDAARGCASPVDLGRKNECSVLGCFCAGRGVDAWLLLAVQSRNSESWEEPFPLPSTGSGVGRDCIWEPQSSSSKGTSEARTAAGALSQFLSVTCMKD